MSDLLSPIYVVFDGEEGDAFWGLVGVMRIMVRSPIGCRGTVTDNGVGIKLPPRSEWDETTTFDFTAIDRCNGSRALRTSRSAASPLSSRGTHA